MTGHQCSLALVLEDFFDLLESLTGIGSLSLLLFLLRLFLIFVPGEHVPDHGEAFLGL